MMNKIIILNYLTDIKDKYQEEGLQIKALFGSYSRNEANQSSDIDILVEATPKFALCLDTFVKETQGFDINAYRTMWLGWRISNVKDC